MHAPLLDGFQINGSPFTAGTSAMATNISTELRVYNLIGTTINIGIVLTLADPVASNTNLASETISYAVTAGVGGLVITYTIEYVIN